MPTPLLTPRPDPFVKLARREFNRKLILWVHGVLAFMSGFVFLSALHLEQWAHHRPRLSAVQLCFPALLPYLLSALASYQMVGYNRIRTWLFAGVVTCGAILTWCLFLGIVGKDGGPPSVPLVLVLQAVGYFFAAGVLFFGFSTDEPYH